MIIGVGTDIVENERVNKLYRKFGQRFLDRIFTADEITYATGHQNPVPYLAARFAVKEAAIKALNISAGTGLNMKEIEVAGKAFGKKKLMFSGKARELIERSGANRFHISLSHSETMSLAVVILERV